MLLCFRDDSATEEPTSSIEDLEFKVHRNNFEGTDHFILISLRKALCFYSITKKRIFFSKKDTSLDERYVRKLGGIWR